MADVGTLVMKVKADTDNFQRGMGRVSSSIGTAVKVVAVAAAAIGAATIGIGVSAIKAAADAEEMRNKYDVVFKGMTGTVDTWSDDFADKVGRNKYEIQGSLADLADLQQGLGMTADESFELSKKVVTLATDLASFNNLNDSEAIEAVSKAMLGEAESAKQLGLLLNVERVKDFAESQGLVFNELTDSAKAALVYELAMTQSQNAIGDAERSSDSFTNQMKRLKSGFEEAKVALGEQLLPVATTFVTWLNEKGIPMFVEIKDRVVEWASAMKDKLSPYIETFTAYIKDNWPAIQEVLVTFFENAKTFATTLWTFFKDNLLPIFKDIFDWVISNWPKIQETFKTVFDAIVEVVTNLWTFFVENLLPIFKDIFDWVVTNWPAIQSTFETVFNTIKTVVEILWTFFKENLLPIFIEIFDWVEVNMPAIQKTFEVVSIIIIAVVQTIVDIITILIETFKWLEEKVQLVTDFVKLALGALADETSKNIQAIVDVFKTMVEWIQSAIDKVKEFFGAKDKGDMSVPDVGSIPNTAYDYEGVTSGYYSPSPGNSYGHGYVSGQYARGGDVVAGSSYLVNEGTGNGEIFTPSVNGKISNGTNSIVININGAQDPNLIADQIVRILAMQGVA